MQETQETQVPSLGQEGPLEKEMETYSSILAWKIPWTEEPGGPGGLQYMGLQTQHPRTQHNFQNHILSRLSFLFLRFWLQQHCTTISKSQ